MKNFPSRQSGGTLVGLIIGLVLGLAIAVAVALFITKAPIPFVNKVGRAPEVSAPDSAKLPDPNKSLYPKELPKPAEPVAAPETPATPAPAPGAVAPAGPGAPVVDKSSPATTEPSDFKQSFLQAGAYKAAGDADNMKAKLALLGFEAKLSTVERDGTTLYRVRVGPYARADDLGRVQQRLTENGIQPQIVPVGK